MFDITKYQKPIHELSLDEYCLLMDELKQEISRLSYSEAREVEELRAEHETLNKLAETLAMRQVALEIVFGKQDHNAQAALAEYDTVNKRRIELHEKLLELAEVEREKKMKAAEELKSFQSQHFFVLEKAGWLKLVGSPSRNSALIWSWQTSTDHADKCRLAYANELPDPAGNYSFYGLFPTPEKAKVTTPPLTIYFSTGDYIEFVPIPFGVPDMILQSANTEGSYVAVPLCLNAKDYTKLRDAIDTILSDSIRI